MPSPLPLAEAPPSGRQVRLLAPRALFGEPIGFPAAPGALALLRPLSARQHKCWWVVERIAHSLAEAEAWFGDRAEHGMDAAYVWLDGPRVVLVDAVDGSAWVRRPPGYSRSSLNSSAPVATDVSTAAVDFLRRRRWQ